MLELYLIVHRGNLFTSPINVFIALIGEFNMFSTPANTAFTTVLNALLIPSPTFVPNETNKEIMFLIMFWKNVFTVLNIVFTLSTAFVTPSTIPFHKSLKNFATGVIILLNIQSPILLNISFVPSQKFEAPSFIPFHKFEKNSPTGTIMLSHIQEPTLPSISLILSQFCITKPTITAITAPIATGMLPINKATPANINHISEIGRAHV